MRMSACLEVYFHFYINIYFRKEKKNIFCVQLLYKARQHFVTVKFTSLGYLIWYLLTFSELKKYIFPYVFEIKMLAIVNENFMLSLNWKTKCVSTHFMKYRVQKNINPFYLHSRHAHIFRGKIKYSFRLIPFEIKQTNFLISYLFMLNFISIRAFYKYTVLE